MSIFHICLCTIVGDIQKILQACKIRWQFCKLGNYLPHQDNLRLPTIGGISFRWQAHMTPFTTNPLRVIQGHCCISFCEANRTRICYRSGQHMPPHLRQAYIYIEFIWKLNSDFDLWPMTLKRALRKPMCVPNVRSNPSNAFWGIAFTLFVPRWSQMKTFRNHTKP